jgi:dTDP-4-amino-4,6-dideoxygalactose transaminase
LPSTFKFGGRRATLQATALAIPNKWRHPRSAAEARDRVNRLRGSRRDLTNIAKTALSLPMHPHLSQGDVERVVQVVKSAIRG